MPDLIYNIKFEIDPSSKKIGDIIDKRAVADINMAAEATENLSNEMVDTAITSDRTTDTIVKNSKKVKQATASTSKSLSTANQVLFSFSDGVQDASQFMAGGTFNFATGMRAIGNNVGFTAELMGNLKTRTGSLTNAFKALGKSFLGPGGFLLLLNGAITAITILSDRFNKNKKEAEKYKKGIDDLSKSSSNYLRFTNDLIAALKELNGIEFSGREQLQFQKELVENRINELQTAHQLNEATDYQRKLQIEQLKREKQGIQARFLYLNNVEEERKAQERIFEISDEIARLQNLRQRFSNQQKESQAEIKSLQEEQLDLAGKINSKIEAEAIARAAAIPKVPIDVPIDIIIEPEEINQSLLDIGSLLAEPLSVIINDEIEASLTDIKFKGFPDDAIVLDIGAPAGSLAFDLEILQGLQSDFNNATTQEERKAVAERIAIKKQEIDSKNSLLGQEQQNNKSNLKAIAQTTASVIPSLFEDQKASAIASALVNAGSAIVRQYADLPLAAAIPASIATAAATKKQIEQIKKTKFGDTGGSIASGGSVSGFGASSSMTQVTQPTQNISFRPSNESDMFDFKIKNEVVVTPKGLALITRAGEREIANSQKSVR